MHDSSNLTIGQRLFGLSMYAGLFVVYVLVVFWWKKRKISIATQWPIVEGHIEDIEDTINHGFRRITLVYTYCVEGERYVGREYFAFVRDEDGGLLKTSCRGKPVLVHYRPQKPQVSMLDRRQL